ncbi:MAG: hypothetical protein ACOCZY_02975 [Bacillota bacterium]
MLNIMNLFNLKRDDKIKLSNGENIREEHIQNGLKNYQGQIF